MKSRHNTRQDRPIVNATDDTSNALLCSHTLAPPVCTVADSPTANSGRGAMNARRSIWERWRSMAILIVIAAAMLAASITPAYASADVSAAMVKDICPGSGSSSPSYLTAIDTTLYFKASDGSTGGSSGGSGTYPPGWGTPAPAVTATKAPAATTTATDAPPGEHVTPAATKRPAAAKATTPAAAETAKKDAPGFTAAFVIAGMLAVAYAMMRRRG